METKNTERKKQYQILNISRHVIQLVAFIFFPGFFILTFTSIGSVISSLVNGSFSLASQGSSLVYSVSVLAITAMMGRFFCGFLCSFGAMGDLMWAIARKLKIKPITIDQENDSVFKMIKYGLLLLIVVLVWVLGIVNISGSNNPWDVFGTYSTLSGWNNLNLLFSLGGLLLLTIMIASLFIERFFCRYLCPLGAIFVPVSHFRFFRLKKHRSTCLNNCSACTRKCSMGIDLTGVDRVSSGECIDCFKCAAICPAGNIKSNPSQALATAVTVAGLTGMYYVGNIAAVNTGSASTTATALSSKNGTYTDGTYSGSGEGYRGTTDVKVTVSNGNISDIEIVDYADDEQFFSKAESTIIDEIISAQDYDVATVSGATFSSNGIIAAVKDALSSQSSTDSTTDSNSSSTDSSSSDSSDTSSSETTDTTSTISVADGTYTGSGTGLRGETQVSVTVASGKITEITITSYEDDEEYFSRASSTIVDEIISSQSIDVSTVSGATYSSNGIIAAVANALNIDFTNPNSSSNGFRGH